MAAVKHKSEEDSLVEEFITNMDPAAEYLLDDPLDTDSIGSRRRHRRK